MNKGKADHPSCGDARARGFTLIEVLAALVIVALGMLGVIQAVTQTARNGTYLREKTLAHWIAMNLITERLAGVDLRMPDVPAVYTVDVRTHASPDGIRRALKEQLYKLSPGARPTAVYGRMPETKLSATHDSASKGPRFVAEPTLSYLRRQEIVALPEANYSSYLEIPSPLPSPRADE